MQVEIYADIVFLINLAMDFFILFITSKLMRKKVKWYRLVLGSLAAAGIYCILLFTPLNRYINLFTAVLIICAGIWITFSFQSPKDFLFLVLTAHVAAFAVGGVGIGLFYFTNIGNIISSTAGFVIGNFSVKVLIAAVAASYVVLKFVQSRILKGALHKQSFYDFKIFLYGEQTQLNGLVDTGNSLCDPISKSPVIVAEFDKIKEVLPEKIRLMYDENKQDDLTCVLEYFNASGLSGRIRMIPFSSLGQKNGIIIGFRPDKIEIIDGTKSHEINDVIIGIYNFALSANGEYHALLNPALIR